MRKSDDLTVDRHVKTLRARTIEILRQAILDFRFQPGERLTESRLCDLAGVSRTTVREALRHLETEGMVTIEPHVGPVVTLVTAEEAREIYEVRAALESLAVGLFTQHATERQIQELSEVADMYPSTLADDDAQIHLDTLDEFYAIVYDGCGNALVAELSRSVRARVRYIRTMASPHYNAKFSKQSVENYQRIMRAVMNRDRSAAESAVRRQVKHAARVAMKILAD